MNDNLPVEALSTSVGLKIPFHDVDATGVAWHGHYLKYFELARDALMEKIGYSYQQMRESGFIFPVIDSHVRYVRPLAMHQTLRVVATLKEWEMRLVVSYRIENEQGKAMTKGQTVQVAVKAEGWEMQLGSPRDLLDRVEALLDPNPVSPLRDG